MACLVGGVIAACLIFSLVHYQHKSFELCWFSCVLLSLQTQKGNATVVRGVVTRLVRTWQPAQRSLMEIKGKNIHVQAPSMSAGAITTHHTSGKTQGFLNLFHKLPLGFLDLWSTNLLKNPTKLPWSNSRSGFWDQTIRWETDLVLIISMPSSQKSLWSFI